MESKDLGPKTKSASVSSELVDKVLENRFLYNELTCGAKSKRELLELDEDIQVAETNHDSIKLKWDLLKSLHCGNIYNQSKSALLEKSISSFSNNKIMSSDHSLQKEEIKNNHYFNKNEEKNTMENSSGGNHFQVVLTPRSKTSDKKNCNEIVPNLQIQEEESLTDMDLNKQMKKALEPKKKFNVNRIVDEPLKTSSVNTGKRKRKKFHGRLKNSNSKSTVSAREINFSDKKNDRRKFKKQKSLDTISVIQTPQYRKRANTVKMRESHNSNPKDFVEIYHNAALKSESFSIVSSRRLKTRPVQVSQHDEEIPELISEHEDKKDFFVNEKSIETLLQTDTEQKDEKLIKIDEHCQMQGDTNYQSGFYDSLYQRNYEMPTMSSKLKRVDKSYYQRINIWHIPFVVGTSISPSHNLGLNIQQVLSIIKTKQPVIPGISPLLIHNVRKGIRPVSSLFEHISHEFAKSCRALNCQDFNHNQRNNLNINQRISSFSCEQFHSNNLASLTNQTPFKQSFACEPLYEEDEESHSVHSEARTRSHGGQRKPFTFENRLESSASKSQQQTHGFQSRGHGQHFTKSAFGDLAGNNFNQKSDKETAQVFTRLYEQFDKMITDHEKLKEQLEHRKDKSLIKEASEMEKEIHAKQQEITTVVNLYNEVLSLKKQMKLHNDRNSSVCIAMEDPAFHISKSTKSERRAQMMGHIECNSQHMYFPNRRGFSMHEAPNTLRLTGLLRQIQAFQRQLVMA